MDLPDPPVKPFVKRSHRLPIAGVAEENPAAQHPIVADAAEAALEIRALIRGFGRRGSGALQKVVELKPRGPQLVAELPESAAATRPLAKGPEPTELLGQIGVDGLELSKRLRPIHRAHRNPARGRSV
jgi:hypothetical protein